MAGKTAPFSRFEWIIAWRYMRAKKATGGVSVMTWISLIGVTLAVFALIAVLAVRSGFRADFVDTIVGANAHLRVQQNYMETITVTQGDQSVDVTRRIDTIADGDELAAQLRDIPGITRAAPIIRGEALATLADRSSFVQVYGMSHADLKDIPLVMNPQQASGSIEDFPLGIALGSGVAQNLGVRVGDRVSLLSATGVQTAAGRSPRRVTFDVVYIFQTGRYLTDISRVYVPLAEAQEFYSKDGVHDEIELYVEDPDLVENWIRPVYAQLGPESFLFSWKDNEGAYLRALTVEDNVMFVIMAILVLIASMNIISGLIMLVKNKGRDIGILRTMGLSEGSILRIFFICGAGLGTIGTTLGVILGCLFAIYIDQIFALVNYLSGGGVWDPQIRGIYAIPAKLELWDVLTAMGLSLFLSWTVTIFPARRAARMNPVEALRYE
ncbi:MAG: ABC transporter permease [Pseudomonadota bacterium]